jgi:hypothetical protein
MRYILGSIAAAMFMVAQPLDLEGQEQAILRRGVKIRVVDSGRAQVGFVDTLTTDSLVFHERARDGGLGARRSYGRNNLRTVDVAEKRGSGSALMGAAAGLLGGAAIGYVIGAATYDSGDCDILVCSAAESGKFAAVLGGVIGVPVGLFASAVWARTRWVPIMLSRREGR